MANRNTLFISPSTIKDSYTLIKNLDENIITPYILIAQEREICAVLGIDLYEALQTGIENDMLSSDERKLLENYISPFIMFETFSLLVEPSVAKLRNAGVVNHTGEYINNVSHKEAIDLKEHYKEQSRFYKQRIVEYLCNNRVKYPLYRCNDDKHKISIDIV